MSTTIHCDMCHKHQDKTRRGWSSIRLQIDHTHELAEKLESLGSSAWDLCPECGPPILKTTLKNLQPKKK